MTGWCPIHDRVYEADDGLCPRCGTALVADEAPDDKPVVIEQPAGAGDAGSTVEPSEAGVPRRTSTVAGIAVAIVVAFVAGLAFPETVREPVASTPRGATSDLSIGVTRTSAGVPLRLESFTQRGRNIVARLTVDAGTLDLGRLRRASVKFVVGGGGEISGDVSVRTTINGFIIEGSLPSDTTPVLGLRIESLTLAVGSGDEIPIDLTGAWPATRSNQPRARRATGTLKPGDGRTIKIYGLVGWADRLEVGLSISGARPDWRYESEFQLVSDSPYSGLLLEGVGSSTLRFDDLPTHRSYVLRLTVVSMSAMGLWEWSFI